ncbi:MAG: 3-deoxy-7-phosphoheptulonate synthase [Anaerolineae bacterium]|nr:3-deoxy-7-phosphoheptulonate synthase [Anaerolineae bacterium]MDW8067681.1 3-deoxy-7-phosphoheptulonate synthase [Anaerolineae bacterium]
MIIVMKHQATPEEVQHVVNQVEARGYRAHVSHGTERTIIGVVGDDRPLEDHHFELLPGVEKVLRVLQPFKLASRDFHPEDTMVNVRGVTIGGREIVVIAGPCAVESRSQILETAFAVKEAGARILRGGAYKPRTSPYSFQGLGEQGLELLAEAREATGLPIITEVMSPEDVPIVGKYTDIFQIGTRNMQNYALLQAVGRTSIPVFLKRGMMNTVQEWLMSAEYVLSSGNSQVILCERGIRTFETATRNTLDINAIPLLKQWTHLPVFADPSHGTGKWDLVAPVARACLAAGADGLIIEVHPHPEQALSDGSQSLKPERFRELMESLRQLVPALGRTM